MTASKKNRKYATKETRWQRNCPHSEPLTKIHALRKERDMYPLKPSFAGGISIHALRKERDRWRRRSSWGHPHFNPRAPQGARPRGRRKASSCRYFNPRAPQGARLLVCRNALLLCYFNPRAPQGARHEADGSHKIVTQFQSTRSARSATRTDELIARGIRISIHALRKERDISCLSLLQH